MTVSSSDQLFSLYKANKALGDKAISSDAFFEIVGYEDRGILCKQFPWPELSSGGEIEVAGPLGSNMFQQQQLKTAQQGAISFYETVEGHTQKMLEAIIAQGGSFDARVYEGTPEKYTRSCRIVGCFLVLDNPDRDHENRSQVLMITGSLFFHYFGNE